VVHAAAHGDPNKDYRLWYAVGQQVRVGEPLYPDDPTATFPYMYPPTLAVFVFAPLSLVGPVGFVAVLTAAAAACWLLALLFSAKLVTGRFDCHPLVYAVPAVAAGPYVWDIFLLGQVNLFLLVLVLGALLALRSGRSWAAGGLLGLAVAVKLFPLSVVVYFAARRRWTAVAATVMTVAAVWVVLPAPVRGFGRNLAEIGWCLRGNLGDQSGNSIGLRNEIGFTRRNQSLTSVAHRLLRPVVAGHRDDVGFRVNLADVTPGTAQAIGMSAGLLLGGVLLVVTRCRFAPTPRAEGLEGAMVVVLTILVSPLAFTYYFCWLLPAWAAAAACLTGGRAGRAAKCGFGLAGLLAALALTEQVDHLLQAYGVTAAAAVVLFLSLGLVRRGEGTVVPGPVVFSGRVLVANPAAPRPGLAAGVSRATSTGSSGRRSRPPAS
jgi:hypothetical protein